ncbi:MAG: imidazolonepropionase [Candidatus Stahlbacteria bacterium]|nr:imidazolonepropionase [Candidatus Stahlbacteria bacterium]
MDDLVITNARELITLSPGYLRRGNQMSELGIIYNGSIAIKDGKISAIGTPRHVEAKRKSRFIGAKKEIDATNKIVMPGFVDCHTHLVFAGNRAEEFELRVMGKTYKEIAEAGGGIINTVNRTRKATEDELFQNAIKWLNYAITHGTTTMEIKSGYGLSLKEELKILKVIKRLSEMHPITIIPTFLGAHSVPQDKSKKEYMDELLNEIIPEASKHAKFCDVFCEDGVFTKEEARQILMRGKEFGLIPKIHADELTSSGGSELAGEVGAISADHIVYPSKKGIEQMKNSIAVLLPGACLFLSHKPPVKELIQAGIPIAIGSDFNPGASPVLSIPIIIGLACVLSGMTPAQAITAATINAAYAIGVADRVGSLEVGKEADLIILDVSSYKEIPYWFGVNPIITVIKNGKIQDTKNWNSSQNNNHGQ